jgi:hypothetical protein
MGGVMIINDGQVNQGDGMTDMSIIYNIPEFSSTDLT